jgi:hypothetical protein
MAADTERREARRQKILARGTTRLASITGQNVASGVSEGPSSGSGAGMESATAPATLLAAADAFFHRSDIFGESPKILHSAEISFGGQRSTEGAASGGGNLAQLAELATSLLGQRQEEAGGELHSPGDGPEVTPSLLRVTGQVLSALEKAIAATETGRICCSVLLAFVLVFVHYIHTCVDSTLLGASPIPRPLLFLASLNGTIVLGWCVKTILGNAEGANTNEEGSGGTDWLFQLLGRMELAARLSSLVSRVVGSALKDGSFFVISFSLLWTLQQVYTSPDLCPMRASIPT